MQDRGGQELDVPAEVAKLTQMKSKVNRLKRSPKAATLNPGVFKTPTRPARGQLRRPIADDSPSNDPDSHQDIIWDTTSPSPIRHGRGQRRAANVRAVDISDLANRIAPKNGRLEEADSSLLQWIGDSAIPCTPELRHPKAKVVSTNRQSTVDDLMRLAKRFDFNMRQDEAQEQSGDAPAVTQEPAPADRCTGSAEHRPAPEHKAQNPADEREFNQDDDLDFLFDGPTQQLSGRISQASSFHAQDVVRTCRSQRDGEHVNGADGFDDDWNSDGLLDDSLLLEMTQNPDLFAAPRFSSTQRLTQAGLSGAANKPQEAKNSVKCDTFQGQKAKSDQTFQPGIENHMENNCTNQGFPISNAFPVASSCVNANPKEQQQHKMQVQQHQVVQNSTKLNVFPFHSNAKEILPTSLSAVEPLPPNTHPNPNSGGVNQALEDAVRSQDGLSDAFDEDLDSFFASDDIWDDGVEDDDLFCEACDNLEELSGSSQTPHTNGQHNTTKAPQNPYENTSQQTVFACPYPPKRPTVSISTSRANTSASQFGLKAPARSSGSAGFGSNASCDATRPSGPSSNGAYKFKQVSSSSVEGRHVTQQGHERGVLAVLQSHVRMSDRQQFKKAFGDSFGTEPKDACKSGAVRCSDAEIERKKQQAMERRRLKMQNL